MDYEQNGDFAEQGSAPIVSRPVKKEKKTNRLENILGYFYRAVGVRKCRTLFNAYFNGCFICIRTERYFY